MGYRTVAEITASNSLRLRLTAAAAQEGKTDPAQWVVERMWQFAAQPGWDTAWESALASGVVDPGNNEGVITDGMILSATQAIT